MDTATRPYPHQIDCAWLASDVDGRLAILITGGEGPIPALALEGAHPSVDDLEALVEALDACSEIAFVAAVPRPDSFANLARRGFFVFDWTDVHRPVKASLGAYELVARPTAPRSESDLPLTLACAVAGLEISGRFTDLVTLDPRRYWSNLRP
jgi:hypothetical protein